MVEEMPEQSNRRRFGDSRISMLHSIEMICDQYLEGFTIIYFIHSILVAVIRGHPRGEKNQSRYLDMVVRQHDWSHVQMEFWTSQLGCKQGIDRLLQKQSLWTLGLHKYMFECCTGIYHKYGQVYCAIEASQCQPEGVGNGQDKIVS